MTRPPVNVEDECPLCGGCGEVEVTTQEMERDTFGCPLCISTELRAENERLRLRVKLLEDELKCPSALELKP